MALLILRPRSNADADIQYFSLYSIFNLLLQINIKAADQRSKQEEAKLEMIPMEDKVTYCQLLVVLE